MLRTFKSRWTLSGEKSGACLVMHGFRADTKRSRPVRNCWEPPASGFGRPEPLSKQGLGPPRREALPDTFLQP